MSPRPSPSPHADSHAYIPSSAQAAMSRQMEQKVPAHLQKYVGANKPAYIPQHAQAELTSFMQKSMPAHLQQYSGAFVQQNIVEPGLHGSHAPREAVAPPPTARRGQQSRSAFIPGEQPNAQFLNAFQPDAAPGRASQPMVVTPGTALPTSNAAESAGPSQAQPQNPQGGQNQPQQPAPANTNPYDFIMNPEKPAKKSGMPGGNSLMQRIAVVFTGLALLIIIGVVGMSLLSASGKEKTENLLTLAQDQTELIRVAEDGTKRATTLPVQNLAQTVQATITSDNTELTTYMGKNGQKTTKVQLALGRDKTTDATLTDAVASNSYDSAFKTIMETELTSYMRALQKAYKDNPGPNAKKILDKQYTSAELLMKAAKQ